ncbi:gas vesicle protein GvpO [Halococcus hamelinensis]|uniref:Gas vesicle synthesis family protein n=1 Tax=Halococcus hamelinensis 100A6 TaxID=1132509 RepID=M0LTS2_9EURY|nr:gas vesicle protein [Halococcus hamelinensis]EMA36533.1 gas vesicle synthesis family protein [Halococcus hamelinensis 100A6]
MADLDPSEYTIDELRDELESIDDPDTLEEVRESESENENRTGALDAIDERLDAVEDDENEADAGSDGSGQATADGGESVSPGILEVRNHVRDAAADLIGRPLDSVIEIEQNDDGDWHALVEIVERNSVPDTQDIIGRYALQVDDGGTITGYRRLDRYRRGDTRRDEEPSQAL